MNHDEVRIGTILARVTYLGLFMNVVAPVALLVIIILVTNNDMQSGGGISLRENQSVRVLFLVLLFVSLGDFIAAYLIRRLVPPGFFDAGSQPPARRFEKGVMKLSVVIFSLNTGHAIYGIVLAFLGAEIEVMMLFVAFSLISYQLLRPRQEYLENLYARFVEPERSERME